MPGRKYHDAVGGPAGAVAALVNLILAPTTSTPAEAALEVFGGYLGGRFGSRLPDLLEPATSSHHRSIAHSYAITASLGTVGIRRAGMMARMLKQSSKSPSNDHLTTETALRRLLAGAAVGVPAGYVSHTLTDSSTPRGIPLLLRGF